MNELVRAIETDIKAHCLLDEEGRAFNGWGVTDKCSRLKSTRLRCPLTSTEIDDLIELFNSTTLEDRVFDEEASQCRVGKLNDRLVLIAFGNSLITIKRSQTASAECVYAFGEFIQSIQIANDRIVVMHNDAHHTRITVLKWSEDDQEIVTVQSVARLKVPESEGLHCTLHNDAVFVLYKTGNLFKWSFIEEPNETVIGLKVEFEMDLTLSGDDQALDLVPIGLTNLLIVKRRVLSVYSPFTGRMKPIYSFTAPILAVTVDKNNVVVLVDGEIVSLDHNSSSINWRIGIAVNIEPSYAAHEIKVVDNCVFIHVTQLSCRARRLYVVELDKETYKKPSVPFEIATLGIFQPFLTSVDFERWNIADPFEELFLGQLVFFKRQNNSIDIVQFNEALIFETTLGPDQGDYEEANWMIDATVVSALRKLRQPLIETPNLNIAAATRARITTRLDELDQIDQIELVLTTKSRPAIAEPLGVSGMRRRVGRVLDITTIVNRDEHVNLIVNSNNSDGDSNKVQGILSALYEEIFHEERTCKILAERRKLRESQFLNRSRFEQTMLSNGEGMEVDDNDEEKDDILATRSMVKKAGANEEKKESSSSLTDEESDAEAKITKPRIRLKVKRMKKKKKKIDATLNATLNATLDATLNGTLDESTMPLETTLDLSILGGHLNQSQMEETTVVVEEKPKPKPADSNKLNESKLKKKKKRKSMLGF